MNKYDILIIDDEPQIGKLLRIILENNDFKVTIATTGKEGILLAASHIPDLIILDIGLPDMSGHLVLKELRFWYSKSIIILSVQNGEEDIISALDNGASDYLVKPFKTGELLARIRSSIRRNNTEDNPTVLTCKELQIDFVARTIKKNGDILKLTTTEYNLMALFFKNEGKVLTHQQILHEIWGVGFQAETQYLRVYMAQLRKKIEENPNHPTYIITESRVGYRFG
ncbi:MAG TPA: response regulator transcription factor [Bacteroidales bacterium]|jgi:two-component system KDP operon response regulator KdpE|nr:response regulator transcription factor [Bacteroidales bacterium]HPS72447.1 response regulator transcription factor [Bacteroidales bacterium]